MFNCIASLSISLERGNNKTWKIWSYPGSFSGEKETYSHKGKNVFFFSLSKKYKKKIWQYAIMCFNILSYLQLFNLFNVNINFGLLILFILILIYCTIFFIYLFVLFMRWWHAEPFRGWHSSSCNIIRNWKFFLKKSLKEK